MSRTSCSLVFSLGVAALAFSPKHLNGNSTVTTAGLGPTGTIAMSSGTPTI